MSIPDFQKKTQKRIDIPKTRWYNSRCADKYIEFLKTGESDYPIELLKIAGVDMSTPEPIEKAMETFNALLDEFEKLVG